MYLWIEKIFNRLNCVKFLGVTINSGVSWLDYVRITIIDIINGTIATFKRNTNFFFIE